MQNIVIAVTRHVEENNAFVRPVTPDMIKLAIQDVMTLDSFAPSWMPNRERYLSFINDQCATANKDGVAPRGPSSVFIADVIDALAFYVNA